MGCHSSISCFLVTNEGFPDVSEAKESLCNVGDLDLIPGLGRSPGRYGNPLQYSCLENPHGQRSLAGYSPWSRKRCWPPFHMLAGHLEVTPCWPFIKHLFNLLPIKKNVLLVFCLSISQNWFYMLDISSLLENTFGTYVGTIFSWSVAYLSFS